MLPLLWPRQLIEVFVSILGEPLLWGDTLEPGTAVRILELHDHTEVHHDTECREVSCEQPLPDALVAETVNEREHTEPERGKDQVQTNRDPDIADRHEPRLVVTAHEARELRTAIDHLYRGHRGDEAEQTELHQDNGADPDFSVSGQVPAVSPADIPHARENSSNSRRLKNEQRLPHKGLEALPPGTVRVRTE